MSEARILSELTETKNELQRLKERMSIGTPTVHKDLSLISLVPKWSGLDSGVTLEEFFASIETSAKLGRWLENDQREIAVMRFSGFCETILSVIHRITRRRNDVANVQRCV